MFFRIIITLFLAFILSGCISVPLSSHNKQAIHSIKVDPEVTMSAMDFNTNGSSMAYAMGGLVGFIIERRYSDKRELEMTFLERNIHLQLPQLINSSIVTELQRTKVFRINNKNPDAIMYLKVDEYGYDRKIMGFSTKLTPTLSVEGILLRNQRIVWRYAAFVKNNFHLPSYTIEEIKKDPSLLNSMWRTTVQYVVHDLVDRLK